MKTCAYLLFGSLVLAGCSGGGTIAPGAPPSAGPQPGTPATPGGTPNGTPTPPAKASYAGVYATAVPMDFTQNGVLPTAMTDALGILIELHDHPGKAILDTVIEANIPDVSSLVKDIPSFIRDILSGLLDQLIVNQVYANAPVVEHVAKIISGIADLPKTTELHDLVTVHAPQADGSVAVEQQITDVDFTLLSSKVTITFDAREKGMARSSMTGTLKPHGDAPIADADLGFAGGTLTLPLGELVLQAAGPLLFSQLGATDLRSALVKLVPCHDGAQAISDALGGYLPASAVEQVCVAALGVVASQVTSKIDSLVLSNVRVSTATALLVDSKMSHQSDFLSGGKWSWTFSIGGSSVTVPSTFEGARVGDAQ